MTTVVPHKLIPLRLPSGWMVVRNYFSDEEPVVRNGEIVNGQSFSEDLLALRFERLTQDPATMLTSQSVYFLWLGWFPEYSPEGEYVLTAARDDDEIGRFASQDRGKIVTILQTWMFTMYSSDIALTELGRAGALVESTPNT